MKKKIWYKVCYYDQLTNCIRFCEVIAESALPEIVENARKHHVGVFVTRCTEEVIDCDSEIGKQLNLKF